MIIKLLSKPVIAKYRRAGQVDRLDRKYDVAQSIHFENLKCTILDAILYMTIAYLLLLYMLLCYLIIKRGDPDLLTFIPIPLSIGLIRA